MAGDSGVGRDYGRQNNCIKQNSYLRLLKVFVTSHMALSLHCYLKMKILF